MFGSFGVAWYIDGELVKTDVGPVVLWPHTQAVFELQWAWGHQMEGDRLLGAHTVRFVVDGQQQIEESIQRYLNALETADRTQPTEVEAKTKRLREKIATLRGQMKRMDQIREDLKRQPDEQLSLTDPDSRSY